MAVIFLVLIGLIYAETVLDLKFEGDIATRNFQEFVINDHILGNGKFDVPDDADAAYKTPNAGLYFDTGKMVRIKTKFSIPNEYSFELWSRVDFSRLNGTPSVYFSRIDGYTPGQINEFRGNLFRLSADSTHVLRVEVGILSSSGTSYEIEELFTSYDPFVNESWDKWLHMVVTQKENDLSAYINGNLLDTHTSTNLSKYVDSANSINTFGAQYRQDNYGIEHNFSGLYLFQFRLHDVSLDQTAIGELIGDSTCISTNDTTNEDKYGCAACPVENDQCQIEECTLSYWDGAVCAICTCGDKTVCSDSTSCSFCVGQDKNTYDGGSECLSCSVGCTRCESASSCFCCQLPDQTQDLFAAQAGENWEVQTLMKDTSNAQLTLPSASAESSWTLTFWAKLNNFNTKTLFHFKADPNNEDITIKTQVIGLKNHIEIYEQGLQVDCSSVDLTADQWIHYTMVHDYTSKVTTVYFSSTNDFVEQADTAVLEYPKEMYMCRESDSDGSNCNGKVKMIAIFNSALTKEQVDTLRYRKTYSPSPSLFVPVVKDEGTQPTFNTDDGWEADGTLYNAFSPDLDSNIYLCDGTRTRDATVDTDVLCDLTASWVFTEGCPTETIAAAQGSLSIIRGENDKLAKDDPTAREGNVGLFFDGIDDFLSVPRDLKTAFSFSVDFWINKSAPFTTGISALYSVLYSSNQLARLLDIEADGTLSFSQWDNGSNELSTTSATIINEDEWTFIRFSMGAFKQSLTEMAINTQFIVNQSADAVAQATQFDYYAFFISEIDPIYVGCVGQFQPYGFFSGFMYSFTYYNRYIGASISSVFEVQSSDSDFSSFSPISGTELTAELTQGDFCPCDAECGGECTPGAEIGECTQCDDTNTEGCYSSGTCFDSIPDGYARAFDGSDCSMADFDSVPRPLFARWRNYDENTRNWGSPKLPSCGSKLENTGVFDVVFDTYIDPITDSDCSTFFAEETNSLFGSFATCLYTNSTTITASLGGTFTLPLQSELVLAEGAYKLLGDNNMPFLQNGKVTLTLPDNIPQVTGIIQSASFYSKCLNPGDISASYSFPNLGNTYEWFVDDISVSTSATFPATFGIGQHTLKLVLQNIFGAIGAVETTLEVLDNEDTPIIEINPPYVEINTAEPMRTVYVITRPSCGQPINDFIYSWSIHSSTSSQETTQYWRNQVVFLENKIDLNPKLFDIGAEIVFKVQAWSNVLYKNEAFLTVHRTKGKLIPLIQYGNQEINFNKNHTLSSNLAHDTDVTYYNTTQPDQRLRDDDISIRWQCEFYQEKFHYPCNLGSTVFSTEDLQQPDLVIPAGRLENSSTYLFTMTMIKDDREQWSQTKISTLDTDSDKIHAWINVYQLCNYFTASSSEGYNQGTWISSDGILLASQSNVAFLNLAAMTPLKSYTVEFKSSETVTDSLTIETNRSPRYGQLNVTPTTGTSYSTQFTATASEWYDDDLPLTYAFYAMRSDSDPIPISLKTENLVYRQYLSSQTVGISCRVYDAFWQYSEHQAPLQITDSGEGETPKKPAISQCDNEILGTILTYTDMFMSDTGNSHLANEVLSLVEDRLLDSEHLTCEMLKLADDTLAVVATVSHVADEAVRLLERIIDLERSCYDADRAFDTIFNVLGMDEAIHFAPQLIDAKLMWEYPGSPMMQFGNDAVRIYAQRIMDWQFDGQAFPNDSSWEQNLSFRPQLKLGNGCVNYGIIETEERIVENPEQTLEMSEFKAPVGTTSVLDLYISQPCTINKWGEFEFLDRAIWGEGTLVPQTGLEIKGINYELPVFLEDQQVIQRVGNSNHTSNWVVDCMQWNGDYWNDQTCNPDTVLDASGGIESVFCLCSETWPTTARITEEVVHDISYRVIPETPSDGEEYSMTRNFSPVWLSLILFVFHIVSYGFAVRADYKDHLVIDEEKSCMGFILYNHLFLSPFFTMSQEKTRVAKVTIIFAQFYCMLFVLGLLYYYERDEHFGPTEGIDVGYAVIADLVAFGLYLIFSFMLNQLEMSQLICFGYCISYIAISVFFGGIIILTRLETEDQVQEWLLMWFLAFCLYLIVFEPLRLTIKKYLRPCWNKLKECFKKALKADQGIEEPAAL